MNLLINICAVLIIGILAVSLIYTTYLTKHYKAVEGDFDSKLPKQIHEHVYIKNPIFFSYGIFMVLLLFIVLFVAITFFR